MILVKPLRRLSRWGRGENDDSLIYAVFTFLLIVGVCSYVVLNPGSYSTPVLLLASFVLCVAACAIAPVWKICCPIITAKQAMSLLLLCFSAFLHFFTGLFYRLSCFFHGSTRLFFGLLH